jgi:hypothetical protein
LPRITPRSGQSGTGNPDTIATNSHRTNNVIDPQIVCPNCNTQIKLTVSLAAPLIAETRKQFESQPPKRPTSAAARPGSGKSRTTSRTRETLDEQVASKLEVERAAISEAEHHNGNGRLWLRSQAARRRE